MAATIVCDHCGQTVVLPKASKTRRFCSNACSHAGRNPSPEQRFWAQITKRGPDECWVWTGHTCKGGYGHLGIGKKQVLTHRFSWVLHNGSIPAGDNVLHRCDNPPCCNPNHLWLGSSLDNNQDRAAKGRNREQGGERNSHSVLNQHDVKLIRELREAGALQREIAARFGVHRVTISDILSGRTWAGV